MLGAQVELKVRSIRCVSRADGLPFELADAMRSEEDLKREDAQFSTVQQDTRLENRWIDLRTPVNQAIFRVQSAVCQVSWQELVLMPKARVCLLLSKVVRLQSSWNIHCTARLPGPVGCAARVLRCTALPCSYSGKRCCQRASRRYTRQS